jgi:hypothetical protein
LQKNNAKSSASAQGYTCSVRKRNIHYEMRRRFLRYFFDCRRPLPLVKRVVDLDGQIVMEIVFRDGYIRHTAFVQKRRKRGGGAAPNQMLLIAQQQLAAPADRQIRFFSLQKFFALAQTVGFGGLDKALALRDFQRVKERVDAGRVRLQLAVRHAALGSRVDAQRRELCLHRSITAVAAHQITSTVASPATKYLEAGSAMSVMELSNT